MLKSFILSTILLNNVLCEVFTSPFEMKKLFMAEGRIVEDLKHFQTDDRHLKESILRYINDQSRVVEDVGAPLSDFDQNNLEDDLMHKAVGNIVHSFRLTRRLVYDLPKIMARIKEMPKSPSKKAMMFRMKEERSNQAWPNQDDVQGFSVSLDRIHLTYSLDAIDVSNGILGEFKTSARLTVDDCLYLSDERLRGTISVLPNTANKSSFAFAIEWREAALELLKEDISESGNVLRDAISTKLLEIKHKHDENFTTDPLLEEYADDHFFIRKYGEDFSTSFRELREEERQFMENNYTWTDTGPKNYRNKVFNHLCQGKRLHMNKLETITVKHLSKCVLKDQNDPYLKLMPVKVEELSEIPFIQVFHDILSPREMTLIKNEAKPKLNRAMTEGSKRTIHLKNKTDEMKNTEYVRTQAIGWLQDSEDPLKKFSHRLDLITGIQVARTSQLSQENTNQPFESEFLQVGLYGPGGVYYPHMDPLTDRKAEYNGMNVYVGNRIATAMFYLSSVGGGATVFPKANVGTFPKPGSVVFWYNLQPNLNLDHLTMHAGCPNLYGVKWVGNKWIRSYAQIFQRPCGITQDYKVGLNVMYINKF